MKPLTVHPYGPISRIREIPVLITLELAGSPLSGRIAFDPTVIKMSWRKKCRAAHRCHVTGHGAMICG